MNPKDYVVTVLGSIAFRNHIRDIIVKQNSAVKYIDENQESIDKEWQRLCRVRPINSVLYVFNYDDKKINLENFVYKSRHANIRVLILSNKRVLPVSIRKSSHRVYYQNIDDIGLHDIITLVDRRDLEQQFRPDKDCYCHNNITDFWSLYEL